MDTTEARGTGTGVAVDTVGAVGVVLTRVTVTLVDVLLALGTTETRQAGTHKVVHLIFAEASVAAGV